MESFAARKVMSFGLRTQNPPLATAYRFESGHRHQKQRHPLGMPLFFNTMAGLEPIQMQQSGGLLPPGVSAGCSIVYSGPVTRTISSVHNGFAL